MIPTETPLPKAQDKTVPQRETILQLPADQSKKQQTTPREQPLKVPNAKTPAVKPKTQVQPKTVPNKPQPQRPGETIIYFENNSKEKFQKNNPKTPAKPASKDEKAKKKAEPKVIDLGDEYYDLEGF